MYYSLDNQFSDKAGATSAVEGLVAFPHTQQHTLIVSLSGCTIMLVSDFFTVVEKLVKATKFYTLSVYTKATSSSMKKS